VAIGSPHDTTLSAAFARLGSTDVTLSGGDRYVIYRAGTEPARGETNMAKANKVIWYEVLGNDGTKLKSFFSELFGWSFKDAKAPGMNYGMTDPEATGIGGGIGAAPGGASWTTFYVGVENVEHALEKAKRLGAKVLLPVTRLPDATVAVFADPEGHPVGLVEQPG
jgi:predicted enzyme related to lactoylglutathione lyase